MKKVLLLKENEVDVKPFLLKRFIQDTTKSTGTTKVTAKVTKKALKNLVKKMGLEYSDTEIASIKKLIEAYMAKR